MSPSAWARSAGSTLASWATPSGPKASSVLCAWMLSTLVATKVRLTGRPPGWRAAALCRRYSLTSRSCGVGCKGQEGGMGWPL